MSYLVHHWSYDPFLVVALFTVALNELGLHRLARRSDPRRTRDRRRRAFLFYAGLLVLLLAVESPIDYWSDDYFFVHMIEHILIMFFAPILVVAGAPWMSLVHAAPVSWRRKVGRSVAFGSWAAPLRATWRVVAAPWSALVLFNAAMVLWHIPGAFDLAETTQGVHIWLMHASFFLTGVLFWLQIIPSRPFHRRAHVIWQIGAILSTNVVMFLLAISMSLFTNHSWYSVYAHIPGVRLSPFADQQLGAAILWVCGDFWALPALLVLIKRAIGEEGSLSNVLESVLARGREAALGHVGAAGSGAPLGGARVGTGGLDGKPTG